MSKLWLDWAIRKEIKRHRRGPRPYHNRMNAHVAVSEASSLYGYFSGTRGIYSHLYVRKDGTTEQYVALDNYSGADYQGNDATISVETQGGVRDAQNEPWTTAQLHSLARILVDIHERFPNIQMRLATDSRIGPSSNGLSWHRLGIDPWRVSSGMRYSTSYGKICPGNAKIAQLPVVLELAKGGIYTPTPVSKPVTPPVGNGGGVKNWLEYGDTGAKVRQAQGRLKELGWYKGALDGSFGPQTLAAVRAFQSAGGLVIDGLLGPATSGLLYSSNAPKASTPVPKKALSGVTYLRRGSRGEAVKVLQRHLNKHYPLYSRLKVDGLFGPATEAVVREFQRRAGLKVDGSAGPVTLRALGLR